MSYRISIIIAAILAGLSVAAGAFASHALKEKLTVSALAIFETAARSQMYHALALLLVGILLAQDKLSQSLLLAAAVAFVTGILLFSGSLYGLSLTEISRLGAIAPLGGLAFLIGWVCLASAALRGE